LKKSRPQIKLVHKPIGKVKVEKTKNDEQVAPMSDEVPEESEIFTYSLWSDLTYEQTEFNDTLDYISSFNLMKINVFALFDFSTQANG
jgi:hypothetical protein